MSRISLYMDEDSTARSLAFTLKSRGVDVITALEANRLGYSDEGSSRLCVIIFAYEIVKCLLGKTFRNILLNKLSV